MARGKVLTIRRQADRSAKVGGLLARRVLALHLAREPHPEDERKGRDVGPDTSLTGDQLLAAVTDAMVAHHRYPTARP